LNKDFLSTEYSPTTHIPSKVSRFVQLLTPRLPIFIALTLINMFVLEILHGLGGLPALLFQVTVDSAAVAAPAAGNDALATIFLPVSIGIIMFSMGITLRLDDFRRVIRQPAAVLIGLLLQMVGLPLLALLVVTVFGLPAYTAVGFLLLAACPGGATSNFIAHLARADVALSISLTAVNSFLILVTIPLIMGWATQHFTGEAAQVELDAVGMMVQILAIVILPVSLGLAFNETKPALGKRLERPLQIVSMVLFVVIVIGAISKNKAELAEGFGRLGVPALVLIAAATGLGLLCSRLMGLRLPQASTIGVEVGIQNATLAIALATTVFHSDEMKFVAGVYGVLMFPVVGIFVFVLRGLNRVARAKAGELD
jgi:BASS family bile acid:Na+ symporter